MMAMALTSRCVIGLRSMPVTSERLSDAVVRVLLIGVSFPGYFPSVWGVPSWSAHEGRSLRRLGAPPYPPGRPPRAV